MEKTTANDHQRSALLICLRYCLSCQDGNNRVLTYNCLVYRQSKLDLDLNYIIWLRRYDLGLELKSKRQLCSSFNLINFNNDLE